MKKLIKENYLFLILFLLLILKEPIYKIINIKEDMYHPTKCSLLESDYNKLLEFNNIDLVYESEFLNTYIIYKDIYNYLNEITIRGGKDKNLSNEPVIYDNTLVGVIDRVNDSTSTVKLITNKNSKISVKINDEIGLLEYKNNELIVSNIESNRSVNVGDIIYTSGLGNTKENIYIGEVKEVNLDSKNIEKIIKVDYKIKIKDLDYVTILKENK